MRHRPWKALAMASIILLVAGCDQVSKTVASARLRDRGTIFLVGDLVVLRYVENQGAFLGLGSALPRPARRLLFIAFPLLLLVSMVAQVFGKRGASARTIVAWSFIAGGGIGNLIDRLARDGRVRDFINLGIGGLRTGVFNAADLAIVVGCVLLLSSARSSREPKTRRPLITP